MPWWGKSEEKPAEEAKPSAPAKSNSSTFNDKLPAREKLPQSLQKIVDKADDDNSFFDTIVDGQ